MEKFGAVGHIISLRSSSILHGVFARVDGFGDTLNSLVHGLLNQRRTQSLIAHTPAVAVTVMTLVFIRVLFVRFLFAAKEQAKAVTSPPDGTIPTQTDPIKKPSESRTSSAMWDWAFRGLLLASVFVCEDLALLFLRTIHTVGADPRELELLRQFVFPLPKFLSFLLGRLLSLHICLTLSGWLLDARDASLEMLLRTAFVWLLGFYLTRRLIRSTWLYVQQRNLPPSYAVGITGCYYLVFLSFDTVLSPVKVFIDESVRGAFSPFGATFKAFGGTTSLLAGLVGLVLVLPRVGLSLLEALWQVLRPDFQYAATISFVVFQFYSTSTWGVSNQLNDPVVLEALRNTFPQPVVTCLLWMSDASVIWSSFADFFFLFIIKMGELSTATSFVE